MRRFNPVEFIIVLIAILVTIRVIRYIPFAPIILIVIVVSMARNQRKHNQEADEKNKEQRKAEPKFSYDTRSKNTTITCDYCGSKVDTSKHAVCDHCGGPYWDDEEWKNKKVG